MLTLVCPRCGNSFQSVLQLDPRTLEGMRGETMRERCSVCDYAFRVKKGEYRYMADGGPSQDPHTPLG
jgi:rubredoxin